ncbi:MAG TPA: hypothetical protein VKU80_17510 [Planctomycetota bacterium]|nr:hypothetical protein [Planctomycetota bacterium]
MVTKTRPPITPTAKPTPPARPAALKTPVNTLVLLMGGVKNDFLIHREGCKRYAADKKRSQYAGIEDYKLEEIANQREVIMEVWGDQIAEVWGEDEKLKDKDYAEASWAWLTKNGFVTSVQFHSCLDGLPQSAAAKASAASAANTKRTAKTLLATLVAEAAGRVVADLQNENVLSPSSPDAAAILAGFATAPEIAQCVAQWLHGMPVDRARFLKVLPRPDRSDWRAENDAANSAANSASENKDEASGQE